jgi:hypothetical protein
MTWQMETKVAPDAYTSTPRVVPTTPPGFVPAQPPSQAAPPATAELPVRPPLRGRIDEDWRARVFRE